MFFSEIYVATKGTANKLYILESNPRPLYSFRGLKVRCGLESRAN